MPVNEGRERLEGQKDVLIESRGEFYGTERMTVTLATVSQL